jgi:hypothetical protein
MESFQKFDFFFKGFSTHYVAPYFIFSPFVCLKCMINFFVFKAHNK